MKYSEFHRWIVGDSSIGRLLVLMIFHHILQMNKFYNPNGFVNQPAPTPRVHHATAPKRHRGPSENAERCRPRPIPWNGAPETQRGPATAWPELPRSNTVSRPVAPCLGVARTLRGFAGTHHEAGVRRGGGGVGTTAWKKMKKIRM